MSPFHLDKKALHAQMVQCNKFLYHLYTCNDITRLDKYLKEASLKELATLVQVLHAISTKLIVVKKEFYFSLPSEVSNKLRLNFAVIQKSELEDRDSMVKKLRDIGCHYKELLHKLFYDG